MLRTAGGATVTVRLEPAGLTDGRHAGLCHYAATYAGLGERRSGTTTIAHNVGGTPAFGAAIAQTVVWPRTTWDVNGVGGFSYSLDGSTFTSFGGTYRLTWGGCRGDRAGLYSYHPDDTGRVDVASVRYSIAPAQRAQRQGAGGLRRFDGGPCPRDPVARDQQASPAVGLPATGEGHHTLACVNSGKVLDVAGPRRRTAGRSCR
ncbi:hypothetical protein [Streptomyces violascens]|uniref:hypothetical protein n=1 Tax=Streptomyces violascens TaxID=67381 RepID=UPI0036CEABE3